MPLVKRVTNVNEPIGRSQSHFLSMKGHRDQLESDFRTNTVIFDYFSLDTVSCTVSRTRQIESGMILHRKADGI